MLSFTAAIQFINATTALIRQVIELVSLMQVLKRNELFLNHLVVPHTVLHWY